MVPPPPSPPPTVAAIRRSILSNPSAVSPTLTQANAGSIDDVLRMSINLRQRSLVAPRDPATRDNRFTLREANSESDDLTSIAPQQRLLIMPRDPESRSTRREFDAEFDDHGRVRRFPSEPRFFVRDHGIFNSRTTHGIGAATGSGGSREGSGSGSSISGASAGAAEWAGDDAASGSNRIHLALRRLPPHPSEALAASSVLRQQQIHQRQQSHAQHPYHPPHYPSHSTVTNRRHFTGSYPTYAKPFGVPSYLLHSSFSSRFFTMDLAKDIDATETATPTPTKAANGSSSTVGGGLGELIRLPTCWETKSVLLDLSSDGVGVAFGGSAKYGDRDAAAILAQPIPSSTGIYYFEVTVISKGHSGYIGIGLSNVDVPLHRLPGWEANSWGYHGDDGRVFECSGTGKPFGPQFSTNDVVGCGIDFTQKGRVFFTKNGEMIGYAFTANESGQLCPSVGLRTPGEHVQANFGSSPFKFDIDAFTRDRMQSISTEIYNTPIPASLFAPSPLPVIPSLHAPAESDRIKETVESMITSYLIHQGYVSTAASFSKQVYAERMGRWENLPPLTPLTDSSDSAFTPPSQPHASMMPTTLPTTRIEIRQAVLDRDPERALDLTKLHYPQVLVDQVEQAGGLLLKLRLRVFIEGVMRLSEQRVALASSAAKGKSRAIVSASLGEDRGTERTLDEILQLGQAIDAEYRGDTRAEVQLALQLAFSLLAYDRPDEEGGKVGFLLGNAAREELADELNSAILVSQSFPAKSPLETMYRHVNATVSELAAQNVGGAVFVNPRNMLGL